ncbi:MAG: ECF transporter S component [Acutalibacter sp.]|jgi:hypothetical protein
MSKTRRCLLDLLLASLCVGLGLLLPWAFRWVNDGVQVLLLLQLPVLLCGMLCGPAYGLSCGLLIVLLPQLFPGAAGTALSTGELWELAIYGFLAGLLTYLLGAAPPVLNVSVSLLGAMLLGRVFCGLLDAFVFVPGYTWATWVRESFTSCLPGIVLQLAAIPLITLALRRCSIAEKP